ncbi:hypothetical protein SD70_01140 [Gordoniibacillus kamchatkensis]|uniref:HTH araC/xylS-type domain-containing protein n=1 Tax=Gordoniibacillus kamchatkensis TaxID=1590651 RepID=A0ABR5ANC3_9BACL|nr:helix-turn-helix transcriptional regulator [Paenibacillus sp. VKM B-2647]KIL42521.1 hypothetical protein SD70_01140 [Paenibacillus sp. VKM B-2647]
MTDISIEQYADQYNLSLYRLRKSFKQRTGQNFIDYVTRLRLDKCKELLLSTDLKVNDIADMLRYQPSYLIRASKRRKALLPASSANKMPSVEKKPAAS